MFKAGVFSGTHMTQLQRLYRPENLISLSFYSAGIAELQHTADSQVSQFNANQLSADLKLCACFPLNYQAHFTILPGYYKAG